MSNPVDDEQPMEAILCRMQKVHAEEARLPEYYAYFVDRDGHIFRRIELSCADDEAAKTQARQLANGHDIELWQLDRMIATFTGKR